MRKIILFVQLTFIAFVLLKSFPFSSELKAQSCSGNPVCGMKVTTVCNPVGCNPKVDPGCSCTDQCGVSGGTVTAACSGYSGTAASCDAPSICGAYAALCVKSGSCTYTAASGPVCGNGSCESGETTASCPGDCPAGGPGPSSPPGSCDGCTDSGSCSAKGGSWSASSGTNHPECAAQGGYCAGTTNCGSGPNPTTPPGTLSCGQSCTSSSQCRNPSPANVPTACINGTCQSTLCPAGETIPGANCSCGANTRKCGETCGAAIGLCAPGASCTYINPPGYWYDGSIPDCVWGFNNFYCAGTQNGYTKPTCTIDDTGGQYLVSPSGDWKNNSVTPQTGDVARSCQLCGDGVIAYPELCDDGVLNGTASSSCTKSCQYQTIEIRANGLTGTITVPSGSNVTIDWNSLGITNLIASDGWSGPKTTSGTQVINNLVANTTFTISGTQTSTGMPVTASVTVNIIGLPTAPVINLSVNGISAPVVYVPPLLWADYWAGKQGMNTTFKWTTTNAANCVGTTLEPSNLIYPFPSAWPYTPQIGWFLWNWTQPVTSPANPILSVISDPGMLHYGTFVLTCTSPAGLVSSKKIVVSALPPVTGGPVGPGQCAVPSPKDPPTSVCALSAVSNGKITWHWQPVVGADQYQFQVENVPSLTPVAGTNTGVKPASFFNCTASDCWIETSLPLGKYRSGIIASSSTNACLASTPGNSAPYDMPLCPAVAWWQSGNGSVFTQGNIQSVIPASCLPPTCINDLIQDGSGIPGLAIGGSSAAVSTGTGGISSKDWIAKSSLLGRVPDYASFVSLIPVSITPSDTGASCGGGTFNTGGATTGDGYYWYRHNGDVTITSDVNLNAGRKVILFVDGNLTINGKITYNPANAYFMPIVKGNITIDPTVTTPTGTPTLTGIFYCDGKFDSGVGTGPLSVLGSVVAKGGVSLQRDLGAGNNFASSENFSLSPDLMLNYPGALSFKRPVWHEVAP